MMAFSDSFFVDPVTHYALDQSSDGASAIPSDSWPGDGTSLTCRAEAATGSSTNARQVGFSDSLESSTGWTLAFQNDPQCNLRDKFVLTQGNRTLMAMGPARCDASGSQILYLVDCEERS